MNRFPVTAAIILAAINFPPATAAETILASLGTSASLGFNPTSGVAPGLNNSLLYEAGANSTAAAGGVFALSPPPKGATGWTGAQLYAFPGGTGGNIPSGGLIADTAGNIYGTTFFGGSTSCSANGCGTVFKLTAPTPATGAYTAQILYAFPSSAAGTNPLSGVIADSTGALYGTTFSGGAIGFGTVFKLVPPAQGKTKWLRVTLHNFKGGADGAIPRAGLVADSTGNLYGTTTTGGATLGGLGTIFRLSPPVTGTVWKYSTLYAFTTAANGSTPVAPLTVGTGTVLYGTTSLGGADKLGTAFSLTPPAAGKNKWTLSILHNFAGSKDGAAPLAGLTADTTGNLFGTTSAGGSHSFGTIFKLTPPAAGTAGWGETITYNFAGEPDAAFPYTGLIRAKTGKLYGTSFAGGTANFGTVYQITP